MFCAKLFCSHACALTRAGVCAIGPGFGVALVAVILVVSHACAGVSIWASISQKLLLTEMRFGNVSFNFQTYDFVDRFIPVASRPLTRN